MTLSILATFLLFHAQLAIASPHLPGDVKELKDVIESVKSHFPLIQAAEQEKLSQEGELLASQGGFDPLLKGKADQDRFGYYKNKSSDAWLEQPTNLWGSTFQVGYRKGDGNFPIYDSKQQTLSNGEVRAGVDIPLLRDGPIDRRRAQIRKNEQGVSIAEARVSQTQIEAIRAASSTFWNWVVSIERVKVMEKLLNIAEERVKQIEQRVQHGDLSKFERDDNLRAILQRKSQKLSAERQLQQAILELSLYWRDSSGNPILPSTEKAPTLLPEPKLKQKIDSDRAIEVAMNKRPELKRFEGLKASNEIEYRLSRNLFLPKLNVNLQVSRDRGFGPTTLMGNQYEGSLQLEIPLFFRSARGKASSSRALVFQIDHQSQLQKERIHIEVRDAIQTLELAEQRYSLLAQEFELAKKLELGEEERFKNGDSNILFVNLREQASADAAVRKVEALGDFFKGAANYKAVLAEE